MLWPNLFIRFGGFFFFAEIFEVPKVDLGFAISATAVDEKENFQQMKDVIKSMIDKYGRGDVLYAVIVFGEEPSIKVRFNSNFVTDEVLKGFINTMGKTPGASLSKALMQAKEVSLNGLLIYFYATVIFIGSRRVGRDGLVISRIEIL